MASAEVFRRALVARYGPAAGSEATADAIAYGWEHRDRPRTVDNLRGYLYRVGQTRGRHYLRIRHRESSRRVLEPKQFEHLVVEPGLLSALESLSARQRTVVLLTHGHGYPVAEVSRVLGISVSSAHVHLRRGMAKLGRMLGAEER